MRDPERTPIERGLLSFQEENRIPQLFPTKSRTSPIYMQRSGFEETCSPVQNKPTFSNERLLMNIFSFFFFSPTIIYSQSRILYNLVETLINQREKIQEYS